MKLEKGFLVEMCYGESEQVQEMANLIKDKYKDVLEQEDLMPLFELLLISSIEEFFKYLISFYHGTINTIDSTYLGHIGKVLSSNLPWNERNKPFISCNHPNLSKRLVVAGFVDRDTMFIQVTDSIIDNDRIRWMVTFYPASYPNYHNSHSPRKISLFLAIPVGKEISPQLREMIRSIIAMPFWDKDKFELECNEWIPDPRGQWHAWLMTQTSQQSVLDCWDVITNQRLIEKQL